MPYKDIIYRQSIVKKAAEHYKKDHLKLGLCVCCPKDGADKVFLQDGIEVFKKRLRYCYKHLVERRGVQNEYDKTHQRKGICTVCHSNPAELCSDCKQEELKWLKGR